MTSWAWKTFCLALVYALSALCGFGVSKLGAPPIIPYLITAVVASVLYEILDNAT